MAKDAPDQSLLDLAATIQRALTEVHQLERTVQMFTESSQLLLFDRTNALVKELGNIQEVAEQCQVAVPAAVVKLVDEGRNPDLYTVELLRSCVKRNENAKGRVEAFKSLRDHLLEEMDEHFPADSDLFREMRMKELHKVKANDVIEEKKSTPLSNGVTREVVEANGIQQLVKVEPMEM